MIIVTGASSGVGLFLFNELRQTHEVVGFYNTTPPKNNKEDYYLLDITSGSAVEEFVNKFSTRLSKIVLINCAGITYNAFAHKTDIEEWNKVIDVNLKGTFNVIKNLLPIMRAEKYGRIINLSSVVASRPTPGVSAYSASKAALSGMVKSLAVENARFNILINNIDLGYSELGMIKQVPEEFLNKIKENIPSENLCPKEEIKRTVMYLIESSYINGSSINLSGGLI
jgi:NAD(P)-dependent dehydrogenase (short-subunit alcohol dehydrogenase family)